MPIRGHSGVQGGAEMGAYATAFPGGLPVTAENAARFAALWGFPVPAAPGMNAVEMIDAAHRGSLKTLVSVGGNFLEILPDPAHVEAALGRVPLRVHVDIVLSTQMLVDPADTVLLLPATTRYETPGGVTETTTERRVVLSPYISGHEIGEAREEWRIVADLVRAARPEMADVLGCETAEAIREDISRTIPRYAPTRELTKQGDMFQWGGTRLCDGGVFPLPGGRARFVTSDPPDRSLAPGQFHLATRRGKQFNSIVQAERDPLTGADRDHVFMHADDMRVVGVAGDEAVRVTSPFGEYVGRAFSAPVTKGTVQMHWPEANVLIQMGPVDPGGKVPDYNAVVRIAKVGAEATRA
jgi:predicted molibdopterin-dependent oxidoreductase YjgC